MCGVWLTTVLISVTGGLALRPSVQPSRLRIVAFQLPPRTGGGQGEWADWDTDSYMEDEYVAEDDEEASSISPTLLSFAQTRRDERNNNSTPASIPAISQAPSSSAADWDRPDAFADRVPRLGEFGDPSQMREPWSEEAPYFDEADVQDDEGNWGRDSSMQFRGDSKGTSLWMSRAEYAVVAEERVEAGKSMPSIAPKHTPPEISSIRTASSEFVDSIEKVPNEKIPLDYSQALESRLSKLEQRISDVAVSLALVKGFGAGIIATLVLLKLLDI